MRVLAERANDFSGSTDLHQTVVVKESHTYRHDLESFFYVFTGMCIRYGYERCWRNFWLTSVNGEKDKDETDIYKPTAGWYTGTYAEIARNKLRDMDKNGFEDIVAEFAPQFENQKQLARELRSALFLIRDGAIFIGTFRDNDIMYDGMIDALSRAVERLRKEEQVLT